MGEIGSRVHLIPMHPLLFCFVLCHLLLAAAEMLLSGISTLLCISGFLQCA
jgi:hypothetical protein